MATYSPSKITKDGNTYNFTDTTKIPLAGTSALAGSIVPNTDNAYNLGDSTYGFASFYVNKIYLKNGEVYGNMKRIGLYSIYGNDTNYKFFNGAGATFTSKDYSNPNIAGVFEIHSANNGSSAMFFRGRPDGTLTWGGQPIQYISDARLKQQISEIDDALLTAWEDVNPVQFKYNDAVKEKSDNARLHTGYVVQQIDEACKSHGVDVSKYGLYCHEEYEEETREVEHEDGTKTAEVVRPANEHYSLRYTEALIVECAYLRKCIKELRNEIEQLKSSK